MGAREGALHPCRPVADTVVAYIGGVGRQVVAPGIELQDTVLFRVDAFLVLLRQAFVGVVRQHHHRAVLAGGGFEPPEEIGFALFKAFGREVVKGDAVMGERIVGGSRQYRIIVRGIAQAVGREEQAEGLRVLAGFGKNRGGSIIAGTGKKLSGDEK